MDVRSVALSYFSKLAPPSGVHELERHSGVPAEGSSKRTTSVSFAPVKASASFPRPLSEGRNADSFCNDGLNESRGLAGYPSNGGVRNWDHKGNTAGDSISLTVASSVLTDGVEVGFDAYPQQRRSPAGGKWGSHRSEVRPQGSVPKRSAPPPPLPPPTAIPRATSSSGKKRVHLDFTRREGADCDTKKDTRDPVLYSRAGLQPLPSQDDPLAILMKRVSSEGHRRMASTSSKTEPSSPIRFSAVINRVDPHDEILRREPYTDKPQIDERNCNNSYSYRAPLTSPTHLEGGALGRLKRVGVAVRSSESNVVKTYSSGDTADGGSDAVGRGYRSIGGRTFVGKGPAPAAVSSSQGGVLGADDCSVVLGVIRLLTDRLNAVEHAVTLHQNQHIMGRAAAVRREDEVRAAYDDCEFRLSELEAGIDARLTALKERVGSKVTTSRHVREIAALRLKNELYVEIKSALTAFHNSNRSGGNEGGLDGYRDSQSFRLSLDQMKEILRQYDAHADARMTSLQLAITKEVSELQNQLRGASYLFYRKSHTTNNNNNSLLGAERGSASSLGVGLDAGGVVSPMIDECRERFMQTVGRIRRELATLRAERIEFESRFLDRIVQFSISGEVTLESNNSFQMSAARGSPQRRVTVTNGRGLPEVVKVQTHRREPPPTSSSHSTIKC